jgi:hypothetical protein
MRTASIKETAVSEIKVSYLVDGDSHRWLVPAAGMEVCLHGEALAGLGRDLAVVRKRARLGEEIGGLLIGSRDFIGRNSVRILRIETYSAAALHSLLGLMCAKAAEAEQGSNTVVGWYRIASRDEAGYTREDESLMRMHFPDPGCVFLLLRPSELQLVFWRGNELKKATAEFAALPVLLAPAAGTVPAESAPRRSRAKRVLALTGLSLLTATLVFTAGVLWNEPPAGQPLPIRPPAPAQRAIEQAHAADTVAVPEKAAKSTATDTSGKYRSYGPDIPLRPFTPPPSENSAAAEPVVPPPAPAVAGVPAASIPALPVPVVDRPPAPPVEQKPSEPAAPELKPAILINRIEPVPPPAAVRKLTQPVVIQVRLTIDPKGEVVDAQAIGAKSDVEVQLARAAVDAGWRWKFTPAALGGRPVLSTMTIQFAFSPAR